MWAVLATILAAGDFILSAVIIWLLWIHNKGGNGVPHA
jgi:hypothetical protein